MTTTFTAIYQNGVLRPLTPTDLEEGARVELIVVTAKESTPKSSPVDILAGIVALPLEVDDQGFSGENHDRVLNDVEKRP